MLGITETGGVVSGEGMGGVAPDTAGMTPEQKKKAAQLKMLGGFLMRPQDYSHKSNSAAAADIVMQGLGGYLAGGGKFDFMKKKQTMAPMDAGIASPAVYGSNGMEGLA